MRCSCDDAQGRGSWCVETGNDRLATADVKSGAVYVTLQRRSGEAVQRVMKGVLATACAKWAVGRVKVTFTLESRTGW